MGDEGQWTGVPDDEGVDLIRVGPDAENLSGGDTPDGAPGVVDEPLEVEVAGAVVGKTGKVQIGAEKAIDAPSGPECDEAILARHGQFEHPVEVRWLARRLVEQQDLSEGWLVGHALRSVSG